MDACGGVVSGRLLGRDAAGPRARPPILSLLLWSAAMCSALSRVRTCWLTLIARGGGGVTVRGVAVRRWALMLALTLGAVGACSDTGADRLTGPVLPRSTPRRLQTDVECDADRGDTADRDGSDAPPADTSASDGIADSTRGQTPIWW